MANETSGSSKAFDPMEPWRELRNTYLETWAKGMVDMVNSEAYAQAAGAMLDTYLTVSKPFREAVETAMLKTLEQLAMPSRADITSIAERMTHIEMRLDDLDAKLDEMRKANAATVNTAATKSGVAARKPRRAKQAKRGKK
jgi:hypothetical protein